MPVNIELLREFIGVELDLIDTHELRIGKIYPTVVTDDLTIVGIFTSNEHFERYRPFFIKHEEFVLNQLFTHADGLEKCIAEFNFRVKSKQCDLLMISDVQLMSAVDISFKITLGDSSNS